MPIHRILVAGLALAAMSPAFAQTWPTKPVRFVVGFAAGGGVDGQARALAEALQKKWGQTVSVENRPGAGGKLATDIIAKADPDGYTIGAITGADALLAVIDTKLPYRFPDDLQSVGMVAEYPFAIVTAADGPYKTIGDLLTAARKPGTVTAANAGVGTTHHLASELINALAKTDILSIPYKGSSSALTDVVSGRVTIQFAASPAVLKTGKLRALAITSPKRSSAWPDTPALAESVPGYQVTSWMGLVVPAKTPQPIAAKLAADLREVVNSKALQDQFSAIGLDAASSTPAEMNSRVYADMDKWRQLVKTRNLNVAE